MYNVYTDLSIEKVIIMSDISKIDKNLAVKPVEVGQDTVFFNSLEEPFKVYGLMFPENEDDVFHRLPYDVAKATNEGVDTLCHHSAGGRVRFKTNSPYVIIRYHKYLLQRTDIRRRLQQRKFGNAGIIEAGIDHIA